MNATDALQTIQAHAAVGNIRYTAHAVDRMVERHVSRHDVRSALVTATTALATGDAWRVTGGVDLDGDGLTVAVLLDGAAVIVTVF